MKKIIIAIACFGLLIACSPKELTSYENLIIENLELADLKGYNQMSLTDEWFKEGSLKLINELILDGASFVAFIGYPGCAYCQDLIPVMASVANDYKVPVLYDNITKDDIEGIEYTTFVELASDYLEVGESGDKELFVPYVIMVKSGKIVYHHLGTTKSHDAYERALNEEETKKIYQQLAKGIEKILTK